MSCIAWRRANSAAVNCRSSRSAADFAAAASVILSSLAAKSAASLRPVLRWSADGFSAVLGWPGLTAWVGSPASSPSSPSSGCFSAGIGIETLGADESCCIAPGLPMTLPPRMPPEPLNSDFAEMVGSK